MMEEVEYQVEYNAGGSTTWYQCGPTLGTYYQARSRMAFEICEDPVYDYRIVKIVSSREIVTTLEAEQ